MFNLSLQSTIGENDSNSLAQTTYLISKLNLALSVIGIIANILCIYAYSQKRMRKSIFNWYLLSLAVFELFFCIILSIDYCFFLVYDIVFHDLNEFTDLFMDYFTHTTDSYIAVITILLSVDRYYATVNPIKIKSFVTNLYAKRLIFFSLFFLSVFKIIDVTMCYKIIEKKFTITYCSLISPLVFNIFPTFIIFVINMLLIKELIINCRNKKSKNVQMNASKKHYETSANQMTFCQEKNQVDTKTFIQRCNGNPIKSSKKVHYVFMIAFSLWLVITTIPYYSFNSYYFIYRIDTFANSSIEFYAETTESKIAYLKKIQNISSIFFNSNHYINFFLYFCFYSNFRHCIYKLFKLNLFGLIKSRSKVKIYV